MIRTLTQRLRNWWRWNQYQRLSPAFRRIVDCAPEYPLEWRDRP